MKIIFNRVILAVSLILILLLSLGMISASDNSDDLIDMACDDNVMAENVEISDSDIGSVSDGEHSSSVNDEKVNLIGEDNFEDEKIDFIGEDNLIDDETLDLDSSSNNEILNSGGGKDFKDIQDLIDKANENDTITLSGTYSGNSKITINKTVSLEGKSDATLDGKFSTQILEVKSPNVSLRNIRFVNSYSMSVYMESSNATIDNCSFENSINGELGSALSCRGDNVKISNSNFLNNIANKSSCHHTDGPAIYLMGNNAIIDNCTFVNNTGYNYETSSSGGAIWLKGFNNTISNSMFMNNSAISKFGWTLHGEEQTYLADGLGGAVYWVGNNGNILNCSFINRVAHTYGGAIYFKAANNCSIENSRFINNYAVGDGGAIYLGQNVFNSFINNSRFEENVALGLIGVITQDHAYGGAIFAGEFVENTSLSNSSFLNNYGNASIYFLGLNLNVANSILNRSNPIIENDTLERFLKVIRDSTLEECIIEINNFTLYSASGSLFEEVIYTDGSLNNNHWGCNINASDEFIQMKLISLNDEYVSPEFWINMIVVNGSDGNNNGSDQDNNNSTVPNKTTERNKSVIVSKDMTTTTVYGADGKIGKYYTIRLTDSNSKALSNRKIIINFNGRNYYRTTDKNGYVKFQINLAKKGTYTFVACFLGDDMYNASFKSSKIKVNPVKAKLKVTNRAYRLSLKKKTLTARFLSSRNKPIVGKRIIFRVNGRNYVAKTNSKGMASVKVILNKRRTYKFTAKFAGDNTFRTISANGRVVVR